VLKRIATGAVVALLIGDAIALVAIPSGAKHFADVLPKGTHTLVTQHIGGARVVLVERNTALVLVVAYEQRSRWHSVTVDPAPTKSNAAWAPTKGSGPVPAFSAVYGRAPGAKVEVHWHDGQVTTVPTTGGVYLTLRRGQVKPDQVVVDATSAA
jgi:hypothetical protein